MEIEASCPYCGEPVHILVDEGGGDHQEYVEDCPVCCRPWEVQAVKEGEMEWQVYLGTSDD